MAKKDTNTILKPLTEKQQEKIRTKIKKIKAALAADKKRWGGYYDDSRGLRYAPPQLYIKLEDYSGGLRYVNWFNKNFPDDGCYPDFLLEWTIILFKTGRLKEAEKKAFHTYCNNIYLFDKFFNKETIATEFWEASNLESHEFASSVSAYTHLQENLIDFSEWLENTIKSEKFTQHCTQFIKLRKQLDMESDREKRWQLITQTHEMKNKYE